MNRPTSIDQRSDDRKKPGSHIIFYEKSKFPFFTHDDTAKKKEVN